MQTRHIGLISLTFWLGILGACSGGGDGSPSTSRLVSWRLETEAADTRPLVLGIYDRELATACRFLPVADGSLRCLPVSAAVEPPNTLFADDRCDQVLLAWTRPILASADRAEPPGIVAISTGSTCAPTYQPRKATKLGAGLPLFERSTTGECQRLSADATASVLTGRDWLVAGEALSPSLFAQGRRVQLPPPAGQRLGLEQIESASGGPFAVGLHDRQWQQSCELERDGVNGDGLSCWPPVARPTWGRFRLYGDSGCGTLLASFQADDETCAGPALVRGVNEVSRIGARWTGTVLATYDVAGDSCHPEMIDLGLSRAFLIGERLGSDAVARLRSQPQGAGPLRFSGPVTDDGRVFDLPVERLLTRFGSSLFMAGSPVDFLDARAVACTPFRVPDGTIRCLPTGEMLAFQDLFFSDDRCSQPLALCRGCQGTKVLIPVPGGDPFGGASAIHEFGAAHTGQAFSTGFSNDHLCRPLEPGQISPTDVLYQLGAKVPFGQYPQLAEWRGPDRITP